MHQTVYKRKGLALDSHLVRSIMAKIGNSRSVKVDEIIGVKPFSESDSTTAFALPLTYFDTFWFKFPPVERLFFYQISDLACDLFNSVILPKLKHSLSLTLLHYLPLTGNMMWPSDAVKPAVYYFPNPKDGVSVTVAESNADFNHLSGNGIREAFEFHHLVPQLSISDDKAEVIAIQITLFPNQGFSIGISSHHAVLDGKSTIMFMKSWAYLCKQLVLELVREQEQKQNPCLLPELIPCFDRTVIKDPKGLAVVYANHWIAFAGSKTRSLKLFPFPKADSRLVRKTFDLNREDIKKLRDKILSMVNENEVGKSQELHLSTYVLTCAHVYVCLVKAKGAEANTTVTFPVTGDCRSRLDPAVPVNYFGNCVGGHGTFTKASIMMRENGVAFVAEKLSDLVKGLKGDVIKGSEDMILKSLAMIKERRQLMLSVAGSTRFDVYGLDFGWGRPKKVEVVSIDSTGAISLAESRDGGGGVEVGVVLDKKEMEAFASLFVNL